jgi:hypothetical protein
MTRIQLLAVFAASVAAIPVQAAPPAPRSAATQHDAQCLVLFLAAAGTKDEKTQQAALAGSWYFLGKLQTSAPGVDLLKLIGEEGTALEKNPRAEEIGNACDAELAKRGQELMEVGKSGQTQSQSSSSS